MLDVGNLHAGYGGNEILKGISFQLQSGTLTGILGINGCGKSTLMKAICGILPSEGDILLCGADVRKLSSRQLSQLSRYIPQRSGLSMDISVLDVMLMGFNPQLGLLQYPNSTMRQRAMDALCSVGLETRAQDNFQSLSEGQKQLCLLSRAMLLEHGLLLLDEPESALDFSGRYKMLDMVRSWIYNTNSAALITLHDPQLALNTCDELLLLQDGHLVATLHPKEDSMERLEQQLSGIYGNLSIQVCQTRTRGSQFVLLKED